VLRKTDDARRRLNDLDNGTNKDVKEAAGRAGEVERLPVSREPRVLRRTGYKDRTKDPASKVVAPDLTSHSSKTLPGLRASPTPLRPPAATYPHHS
jgi:hypothetical protein